jgi:Right handed beta helix region
MLFASWLRTLKSRFRPRSGPARRRRPTATPCLEILEDRTLLSTFSVTNTLDDGSAGSLRWAITQANADTAALSTINFNIAPSGVQTIYLNSALPVITQSVVIDGTTEPGWVANTSDTLYNANLTVVLDGSNAGASEALRIAGGNSTVEGLQIQNFAEGGIHLLTNGNDCILGNSIQNMGFTFYDSPNDPFAGGGGGVYIDGVACNTIGGTTLDARNEFAYGDYVEVHIAGAGASNNQVLGNVIGTDGTSQLDSNCRMGVLISNASHNTIGGTATGSKNVITSSPDSGFESIEIFGLGYASSDNVIQGNFIDTDSTGSAPLQSQDCGIGLDGDVRNTLIGGPMASARNVISGGIGEGGIGIDVTYETGQKASGTEIQGNYIGLVATGDRAIAGQVASGITDQGDNTSIVGNVISGWGGAGIDLEGSGAIIQGNRIGTDSTGLHPVPNGEGIFAGGAQGNMVGQGNIIAYNNGSGVGVLGTGVQIEGNAIYGNAGLGIDLGDDGVTANTPGGPFVGTNNYTFSGTFAEDDSGATPVLNISVSLQGFANTEYTITRFSITNTAFFENSDFYTGLISVFTTDASGNGNFSIQVARPGDGGIIPDPGGWTLIGLDAAPPHFAANYLQNYPVLASATSGSSTVVSGTLNGQASTTFTVDVYANPTADPSGHGQGQYYLGHAPATTDANGNASFSADFSAANLPGGVLPAGWSVSATATDPGGNTSEFSADVTTAPGTQSFSQYLQATMPQSSGDPVVISIQVGPDQTPATVIPAVNGLINVSQPVTIILDLGGGTYSSGGFSANPPTNVTFVVQNGTLDPSYPALTVAGGLVSVLNCTLTTTGDAPTILVAGGSLTLRNDIIQESSGFTDAAISITGGTVDLGTATDPGGNTINVNGSGTFIYNTMATSVSAVGDTFERNGQATAWPAPLTVVVTNSIMLAGNSPPPLTGSVNGTPFTGSITYTTAYGDQVTVTLSTAATSASAVGKYAVIATLSGASAANYVIDPTTSTIGTMYVVSVGADPDSTGVQAVTFWDNKGNSKRITAADVSALDGLNLVNQGGAAFNPNSVAQLQSWLSISPNANVSYQLAVQLAVMELNVLSGDVHPTDLVYAAQLLPYAATYGIAGLTSGGFIDVQDLLNAANTILAQVTPGNPSSNPNQAYETALTLVLQAANANSDFVQQEVMWNLLGL